MPKKDDKNEVLEGQVADVPGSEPPEPEVPTEASIKPDMVNVKNNEIVPHGANDIPIPKGATPLEMVKVETIGTLKLSAHAEEVLNRKMEPEIVCIRPNDGILYMPWTFYASRLNEAFGIGHWGLMPQGSPQITKQSPKQDLVVWGFALFVEGIFISFAIGEMSYNTTNAKMSYADAAEGAKSNSLARNCKNLGMTLELWDKEWCEEWKRKFARKNGDDWVRQIPKKPVDTIATVKALWIAQAIDKGILIDRKDEGGFKILTTLLGETYTKLSDENLAANKKAGLELIAGWKPSL
jgi:hypothetical protein